MGQMKGLTLSLEEGEAAGWSQSLSAKVALYIAVAIGFSLTIRGVGHVQFHSIMGLTLVDLWLVLGSPFFAVLIWRSRHRWRKNVFAWSALAISLAHCVGAVGSGVLEYKTFFRELLWIICLFGIGSVASERDNRVLLWRGVVLGGLLSVVLSLLGYAGALFWGEFGHGEMPFVRVGPLLGFEQVPRLTGTDAFSPQHYGESLVAVLAVSLSGIGYATSLAWKRLAALMTILGAMALTLTVSFAWIGGLALFGVLIGSKQMNRRFLGWVYGVSLFLAWLVGSWAMNVGMPLEVTKEVERVGLPCKRLDTDHKLFAYERSSLMERGKSGRWLDGDRCYPKYVGWPYPSLMTTYAHAKLTAVRVIRERWLWGTGLTSYPRYVRALVQAEFEGRRVSFYRYPHCTYLTEFATAGILGLGALLCFILCIFWARPRAMLEGSAWRGELPAIWLGIVGFFLMGVNVDIMINRSFWVLLALLFGIVVSRPNPKTVG